MGYDLVGSFEDDVGGLTSRISPEYYSIRRRTEVQASPAWTAPIGTLGRIVDEARVRAAGLQSRRAELESLAAAAPVAPSMFDALATPAAGVSVIAEVKRRSPSKGWINAGITAADQAKAYEAGGAAAVSVLTEPVHFGGSIDDLFAVRAAVRIPALKKDFHVDPIQMLEARGIGASAALLIARALGPSDLPAMTEVARRLGLEVIVEIRDEDELVRALDAGATIIGVNNRNLETLEIDPRTSERLIPKVPASVIAIAESGVTGRADVERVANIGADAVLVGSAISAAADPSLAVRALAGVPRVHRA
jgi:indole-3-glycerol phosphate synthase